MIKKIFIVLGIAIVLAGNLIIIYNFITDNFLSSEPNLDSNRNPTEATIGFIGCSNTRQTIQGYDFVGGKYIWPVKEDDISEYDGGAVSNWAEGVENGNKFWRIFEDYLVKSPNTNKVWWQLCIRKEEADVTYAEALPVLELLREKIPNVTVYVSPLADYTESVCEITGVTGLERGKTLAEELDEQNQDVMLGPILGPLSLAELSQQEDTCHPNIPGIKKMGEQMKEFFDGNLN